MFSPHVLAIWWTWPTSGWDPLASLGHPNKFQRVSHLGSVTARHSSSGRHQTLRRWTEGATCIRQGGHHVGHWPTFLVSAILADCAAASDLSLSRLSPVLCNYYITLACNIKNANYKEVQESHQKMRYRTWTLLRLRRHLQPLLRV